MPNTPDKITASSLQTQKQRGQKISMLTAYDYPTALLQDEAGIDVVFVGDSVGTNVLGYRSPQQVTMDDILHHLRAVRRAVRRAETADLKIVMFDGQSIGEMNDSISSLIDKNSLVVFNKMDLGAAEGFVFQDCFASMSVSLKTGENISNLLAALEQLVLDRFDTRSELSLTRARHRVALVECHSALDRAASVESLELLAEDLRLAARGLGRITGRVDVEDLLDVIFGEFCIGK